MTTLDERALHGSFSEDFDRWAEMWGRWPGATGLRWFVAGVLLVTLLSPVQATAIVRLATFAQRKRVPIVPALLRQLNISLFGLDIVPGVPIGGGLYMPHTVGTVVMARRLGRNVTLVSNVTIGMRDGQRFPVIGDNVYVGAGARILGDIEIGDGAVIGANAVVLTDVPPGATAVGIPARIIPHDSARDHGKF